MAFEYTVKTFNLTWATEELEAYLQGLTTDRWSEPRLEFAYPHVLVVAKRFVPTAAPCSHRDDADPCLLDGCPLCALGVQGQALRDTVHQRQDVLAAPEYRSTPGVEHT